MSEKATREKIIEAAEELMLEHSFHAVGLKQLLDAVKVPKGSFYHYFSSKEQFGVEMLHHYMAEAGIWKRKVLLSNAREPNPLKRLFAYLDGSIDVLEANPGHFPCLAVKLAAEVSDMSDAMREQLARGFEDWIQIYQALLEEAVESGLLPQAFDAAAEAQLIQDLWAGSVQRAVTYRQSDPVRNAVALIKERINAQAAG